MSVATAVGRLLPSTDADLRLERRLSAWVIALAPLFFVLMLALAPAVNPTFDDAKYVGVGRNFLAGDGPLNVFGVIFLKHSPLWPVMIVGPESLFGIDPILVGHLFNVVSGALTVLLIGVLGWRIRPAVGAITAVVFAILPYFIDLARTAGIDLPSIALTLLFLLWGGHVVRSGSAFKSALLGLLFAFAFLIKETILPFAVVPFVLGVMWGVRWRDLLRTAGVTLLAAAIGMSWWFVMYADYTGQVYRADFPEWTLVPSAIAAVVIGVLGLAADPLAEAVERRGIGQSIARRLPGRIAGLSRTSIGWLLTLAWFAFLVFFFNRTPKLLGASLFDPHQIAYMLRNANSSVRVAFAMGMGTLLIVFDLIRDRRRVAVETVDVLVMAVCGFPLVLLVFGVGETPRHYVAELALLILLGVTGVWHGLVRLRERDWFTVAVFVAALVLAVLVLWPELVAQAGRLTPKRTAALVVAIVIGLVVLVVAVRWMRRRDRLGALISLAVLGFVVATVGLGMFRTTHLKGVSDANETQATNEIIAWIKANVPPGSTVAFGPYLAMNNAIELPAGYKAIQVRDFLAIADPSAPLGMRGETGTPSDFVAVDNAPIKANQFNVYAASEMTRLFTNGNAVYYVFPVSEARSSKEVLNVLTPQNGFTELPLRQYVGPYDTIDVHTYRIDLAKLHIPTDQMFVSNDALTRLADRLSEDPAGATAAGNLVQIIVPAADGSQAAGIDRLRKIAGQ